MKLLIGTKNPCKIEGAKQAFSEFFKDVDVAGFPVPSNVPNQPVNKDIYIGAKNRVNNIIEFAKTNNISADYYLGIESGITNLLGKWIIINIAVIKDSNGYESWGTSEGFPVPNKYVDDIIKTEFSDVADKIFNQTDLRSGKGSIGILTHNKFDRIHLTKQAFVMALTQFINKDIWKD